MKILEVIQQRYSCRSYSGKGVEKEKLNRVLEAARLAPSAHNAQNWKFIVVESETKQQELARAAGQSFIAKASVIIVGVALAPNDIMSCDVPCYAVDLAIALEHIALQATKEGLATCWIGAFNQQQAKDILAIPETCKIVALMPLGYPSDSPLPKNRKSLEEIVSYENY